MTASRFDHIEIVRKLIVIEFIRLPGHFKGQIELFSGRRKCLIEYIVLFVLKKMFQLNRTLFSVKSQLMFNYGWSVLT